MDTWADFFGKAGFISSQLMNLSAIPSIIQIYRAKSTLSYPAFPLIISLTNAIHNIIYANAMGRDIVIFSSSLTVVFNLIFISMHYSFSRTPRDIIKQLLYIPLLSAVLSLSYVTVGPSGCRSLHQSCFRSHSELLGLISTTASSLSYCGQLVTIKKVVNTKDASSISPWMTAAVAIRAACWTGYAVCVRDSYYIVSSSIGIVSAGTQIFLLLRYRAVRSVNKKMQ